MFILAVPSPPTAPLEIRQIAGNTIAIEWGRPESDGGAPLEAYKIAIRDVKKTMWMEVGRVKADIQKLTIRDLQEKHEYLFRIFAKNEVGFSEPLESDEPIKIVPATGKAFTQIFHFYFFYLYLLHYKLLLKKTHTLRLKKFLYFIIHQLFIHNIDSLLEALNFM